MILPIVIIIALIVLVIFIYNSMIKLRNRVKEAWSDIDVQLKRRYNLIPNIVETVKGYATHEEEVLTNVTKARTSAINAGNVREQSNAENMLSGALKSLFAVTENYPELKANENFMQLQNELVDTEDKIQAARRFYNGAVRDYNIKTQQSPSNIIAKGFHFKEEEYFEIENEEQKENVQVSFDNKEKTEETPAPVETPSEPIIAPIKEDAVEEKSKAEPVDEGETTTEEKQESEPESPAVEEAKDEPVVETETTTDENATAEETSETPEPEAPTEEAPTEEAPKGEEKPEEDKEKVESETDSENEPVADTEIKEEAISESPKTEETPEPESPATEETKEEPVENVETTTEEKPAEDEKEKKED